MIDTMSRAKDGLPDGLPDSSDRAMSFVVPIVQFCTYGTVLYCITVLVVVKNEAIGETFMKRVYC